MTAQPLLEVENLTVDYWHRGLPVRAVDDVSFSIAPGERLGIVGESGSGKSTVALALLGLLPPSARIAGSIRYQGMELANRPARELARVRGNQMAIVFQDAKSALDPVRTVGSQIVEAIRAHRKVGRKEALAIAEGLLRDVDIPQPASRLSQYPHELSGGMRQRAMIAVALAASPKLLIADEPTSSLDVTTQGEVVALLERLCRERKMSVLLITHDLGVIAGFVDNILVMYAGAPVEAGSVFEVFENGGHPYTRALIESIPRLDHGRMRRLRFIPGTLPHATDRIVGCRFQPRCAIGRDKEICGRERPPFVLAAAGTVSACFFSGELSQAITGNAAEPDRTLTVVSSPDSDDPPLLGADGISKSFTIRRGAGGERRKLHAVSDVNLRVGRGEALGIVGESGSGKTTLARMIVGLEKPDSGSLVLYGQNDGSGVHIQHWKPGQVQMIFQDPADSLDPAMSVEQVVAEPLVITRGKRSHHYRPKVENLLRGVGLAHRDIMSRKPWQLSGGQQQRVAIARALTTEPLLLVCDEPVSSLDMSARGQILNLLMDLRATRRLAVVQISHDLSIVRHTCDRVAVMYAGKVVELATTDMLFRSPQHPYTQALIQAVPIPDPRVERARPRVGIRGEPPDLSKPIVGCPFRSRCPIAAEVCATDSPALLEHAPGHLSACHFADAAVKRGVAVDTPTASPSGSKLTG